MTKKNKLFLASGSPRRRELAFQVFENISFFSPAFEEPLPLKTELGPEFLKRVLDHKAAKALESLETADSLEQAEFQGFLLVADTTVALGKKILNKPASKKEARSMLGSLSGRWHSVFTGYHLAKLETGTENFKDPEVFDRQIVETRVKFAKLSSRDISDYVKSGESMDKAGAYGFQELGMQLVEKVDGPYTNVIGLPVLELKKSLERL